MLHLRSSLALKELFQSPLKGPTGIFSSVTAVPAATSCVSCCLSRSFSLSSVALNGRAPNRRLFASWWRVPLQTTTNHDVRSYCSKGDGQNEAAKDSSAEK